MSDVLTISEFRATLKDNFNKALAGNPVVVERGGVRYILVCEVVTFQEPKGASPGTAVKVDKILTTPSIPPTPVKSNKFPPSAASQL